MGVGLVGVCLTGGVVLAFVCSQEVAWVGKTEEQLKEEVGVSRGGIRRCV